MTAPLVTSHRWRPYAYSRLRELHGKRACAYMHCHLSPEAHASAVALTGKRAPRSSREGSPVVVLCDAIETRPQDWAPAARAILAERGVWRGRA